MVNNGINWGNRIEQSHLNLQSVTQLIIHADNEQPATSNILITIVMDFEPNELKDLLRDINSSQTALCLLASMLKDKMSMHLATEYCFIIL